MCKRYRHMLETSISVTLNNNLRYRSLLPYQSLLPSISNTFDIEGRYRSCISKVYTLSKSSTSYTPSIWKVRLSILGWQGPRCADSSAKAGTHQGGHCFLAQLFLKRHSFNRFANAFTSKPRKRCTYIFVAGATRLFEL